MKELVDLPNISKVLAAKLEDAGINSKSDLYSAGAKEAFFRIRAFDPSACINMLYALEGAIQGIRWHNLEETSKNDLKDYFNTLNQLTSKF